ncbi:MAG: hypothetical protein LBV53_01005 [Mycoplasmataceae bacterium]|nr:hypothetical protein [Mycoplasmataceae bacterium]
MKGIQQRLVGQTSGKHFEQAVIQELTSNGSDYVKISADDLKSDPNFKQIKALCADVASGNQIIMSSLLNNQLKGRNGIVFHQPFGSQQFPDILLAINNYIIPFETKFSNNKGVRPTWNSNLPHDEGVYIFGSKGKNDITFFNGMDILSTNVKIQFSTLIKNQTINLRRSGNAITQDFDIYLRAMYNQKLNCFKNSNRKKLEDDAIKLFSQINA